METKLIAILAYFGFPASLLGVLSDWGLVNMDNWKTASFTIFGITSLSIRLYFYVVRQRQARRLRDLQIKRIEKEINDLGV